MSNPICFTYGADRPVLECWFADTTRGMVSAAGFSPVVVASDVPRAARSDAGANGAENEVVLRNGRLLRVPEDAAPARVMALADVLERSGR